MMRHQHTTRTLPLILIVLFLAVIPIMVNAQTTAPEVTKTAEYNIGTDCPVSATLNPDQTAVWVLMNNCGARKYTLQGFNIADGSPIAAAADHFASALTSLDNQNLYSNTVPLAFTPDGIADVIYNESEKYDARNVRVSLTADQLPSSNMTLLNNDALQKLIPGYAGYPETTTYSTDHTWALVADTNTFHIVDLQAGKDLAQITSTLSTDYSTASFSQDNQRLYLTTIKNPDDMQDNSSTLNIYTVPDAKLLQTYDVPTYFNHISPDERYIAGQLNDTELVVTELATGSISQPITIPEKPHAPTECLNSGKKISADLNYMTRGDLFVMDLIWLPDSSGFMTVNSYLGDGSGGGGFCAFDYSRLRQYKVQ